MNTDNTRHLHEIAASIADGEVLYYTTNKAVPPGEVYMLAGEPVLIVANEDTMEELLVAMPDFVNIRDFKEWRPSLALGPPAAPEIPVSYEIEWRAMYGC